MHIVIQSDVFVVIFLTALICILTISLSKRIDKLDPLAKPTGILLPVILGVSKIRDDVTANVGPKLTKTLGPYILSIAIYIFLSNIQGLFSVSSPTANYSVTLVLAAITWTLTQIMQIKVNGIGAWFHGFIEPLAVFLPMNIFGKFASLVSMSLRLFGNIMCGGVIMTLIYAGCQAFSNWIASWFGATSAINFMAPILAPALHAYFDLFAAFIQTLIFVTLTMVFIGNEMPEDMKKSV